MVRCVKNLLTPHNIKTLLDYVDQDDDRTDHRPDVRSKHPRWDIDLWPQDIVKRALDLALIDEYEVDEVVINRFRIGFRVHADSGSTEQQRRGFGIILPLYCTGESNTVFFDNYWNKSSAKFSRKENSPFQYQLPNRAGEFVTINDIREFHSQCQHDPGSITEFDITDKFIEDLVYLIDARSDKKLAKVDNRVHDYSDIVNYRPNEKFDVALRNRYLSHVDQESLDGLTVDEIVPWIPGDAIVFDRNQLHAASNTHQEKCGITIFTRLPA